MEIPTIVFLPLALWPVCWMIVRLAQLDADRPSLAERLLDHSQQPDRTVPRTLDDGHGNEWVLCERESCGLEIVRPGKVQCWCDDTYNPDTRSWDPGPGPLREQP